MCVHLAVLGKWKRLAANEQEILQLLCDQTHASVTMRLQMEQLLRYCTLANIPYEEMIRGDLAEQTLCCRDRKEGKAYFEQHQRTIVISITCSRYLHVSRQGTIMIRLSGKRDSRPCFHIFT